MRQYEQLWEDCKQYLNTRCDLLRLELLDKLSQIIGLIVMIIVLLLLAFVGFVYFSVALVRLMSEVMHTSVACCILGGVFVLIVAIFYWQREKLFINPFVRVLSGILFNKPKEEKPAEDETTL